MLCKCHWIVLYTVHFTAFCSGGPFFSGHAVFIIITFMDLSGLPSWILTCTESKGHGFVCFSIWLCVLD